MLILFKYKYPEIGQRKLSEYMKDCPEDINNTKVSH